jgi:hypothetical protein
MKKSISLIVFILALMTASISFGAAGNCTQAVTDTWLDNRYVAFRTLTFVCTSGSAGEGYPSTAVSAANMSLLTGWLLMNGSALNGATGPTALTAIFLSTALKGDILGGSGKTATVATAGLTSKFTPLTDTGYATSGLVPITADLTLTSTGNAVNSAVMTLVFEFVK